MLVPLFVCVGSSVEGRRGRVLGEDLAAGDDLDGMHHRTGDAFDFRLPSIGYDLYFV